MARISKRKLIREVEKLEPAMAREFARAIESIRSQAVLSVIADLIAAGEVEAVTTALGIDAARFSLLAERLREAFIAGAKEGTVELPVMARGRGRSRMRVAFTFDLTSPGVQAWLTANGGRMITGIVEDQRRMIVETIRAGVLAGQGPRQTALEIVGRIGETGRRTGGLVGLTADQAQYVRNARAALESGDAAQMRGYLDRKLRDKRFDGIVKRAIKAAKPVAAADVQRIIARYADRLLKARGENIARTEVIGAFNAAREEAFRQAIAAGGLAPENVTGTWSATGDTRTRHTHMAMNGQKRKFGQPFTSPSGARLMYPGDTSLGAPASEIINCRCMKVYRVDNVAEVQRVG